MTIPAQASTIAPQFTGWPSDWPSPYYCSPQNPPLPYGWQCTVWAAWRYHKLTGRYVPFGWGNALTWRQGAQGAAGWSVSNTPIVPSIACLQPGVDGAFQDGHVCIVEQINADGSVLTSNMNWGVPDGSSSAVEMVTHKPQPGLSFLYLAGTGAAKQSASAGNISSLSELASAILGKIGVPQAALTAMNVTGAFGANVLTIIGVALIGAVLALMAGAFFLVGGL